MQILFLNTWGGRAGKGRLLSFFRAHADTIDVFCLQEIWSAPHEHLEGYSAGGLEIKNAQAMTNGLQEISAALPNHTPFFRPHYGDHYGLLMLLHKNLAVREEGEVFVYKQKGHAPEGDLGNHARNIQYTAIGTEKGAVTVINFHGLWNGKGKTDTAERIKQSENILAFAKNVDGACVIGGDFNLLPGTESIKLFETAGLRNLIKEYGISSTRTSFYAKPEKHADYVFISRNIILKDFKVLPDEVSDHAPLLIEIQ